MSGSICFLNDEGARTHLSVDGAHTLKNMRYCGRFVGPTGYASACGRCDGRCGPTNGCQCLSCARLQAQLESGGVPALPRALDDGEVASMADYEAQFQQSVAQLRRLFAAPLGDSIATPAQVLHDWNDKFLLAEQGGNMFLAAALQALRVLGLGPAHVARAVGWAQRQRQAVTLYFRAEQRCLFVDESVRTVEYDEQARLLLGLLSVSSTKINRSTQYNWSFTSSYRLCLCPAARNPDTDTDDVIVLCSNTASQPFTTAARQPAPYADLLLTPPLRVDVTWLFASLQPLDDPLQPDPFHDPAFRIDRTQPACRTPRRNADVAALVDGARGLLSGLTAVLRYFFADTPATPPPLNTYCQLAAQLFLPVVPLLGTVRTAVLFPAASATPDPAPAADRCFPHLLAEQQRCLHELHAQLAEQPPGASALFTAAEAQLCCTLLHTMHLAARYIDTANAIEAHVAAQLLGALGSALTGHQFAAYMRFHWQRTLRSAHRPRPFAYAVRASPSASKDGAVSIAQQLPGSAQQHCSIATFVRHVPAGRAHPMRLTVNAGTQLTFTGERYVHSWFDTEFAGTAAPAHELTARCSNFGVYALLLGTIPAADQFSATHAFLLRGRCLLRIALLVERLPSPGEFRDAIASLSPQQQAFAKAYRAMQLNATLFAVCVVQVKPQLEQLLRLPPGSLTKELALTDDLIALLTDWHFPPDQLSLDPANAAALSPADAVHTVRRNADRLLTMIADEKRRLFEEEERRRRAEEEERRRRAEEEARRRAEEEARRRAEEETRRLAERASRMQKECEEVSRLLSANIERVLERGERIESLRDMSDSLSTHSFAFRAKAESRSGFAGALGGLFRKAESAPEPPAASIQQESAAPTDAREPPAASPAPPADAPQQGEQQQQAAPAEQQQQDDQQQQQQQQEEQQQEQQLTEDVGCPTTLTLDAGPIEDYTLLPTELDQRFGAGDDAKAVRAVTIKPDGDKPWTLTSHPSLAADWREQTISDDGKKQAKNVVMDLLDSMTRSGELPISSASLHVVLGQSHAFASTLMNTLLQDNVNPIDSVERTTLVAAETILRVSAAHMKK